MYQPIRVSEYDKMLSMWSCPETEITGVWYTRDHNPHFSVQAMIHYYAANAQGSTGELPHSQTKCLNYSEKSLKLIFQIHL